MKNRFLYAFIILCIGITNFLSAQSFTQPELVDDRNFFRYELSSSENLVFGKDCFWDFRDNDLIRPLTGFYVKYRVIVGDSICIYSNDGQTVHYASLKDGQYRLSQIDRNNYRLVYEQPRPILHFPLDYEASHSSEQGAIEEYPQKMRFPLTTLNNVALVGCGRLILPDGREVKDAFLVKTRYESLNLVDSSGYTEEIYRFYGSGHLYPLIEIVKRYETKDGTLVFDKSYFYQDENPPLNTYYYEDGLAESSIFEVWEETPEHNRIQISPNPTDDRLHVDIDLKEPGRVSAFLQNLSGQAVDHFDWSFETFGSFRKTIFLNTYNLPVGTYLLRVELAGKTEIHKIQKIN